MKLKNPEYRKMYDVVKESFAKNLPKVLISVFLCMMLKTFSLFFVSTPLSSYRNFISGGFTAELLLSIIMFLFSLVMVNVLDFGLVHYLTEIIIKKESITREILKGFTVPLVWLGSLLFSIIEAVSFLLALAFFYSPASGSVSFIFQQLELTPEMLGFFKSLVLSLAYIMFSILLKIPFIFTWNIINENNDGKLFDSFLKSLNFLFPRIFHFIGFVIYINYKNLVLYIVFFIAELTLNSDVLGFVISFAAFVQLLLITLKSYVARPVYYYSLLSVNGLVKVNETQNDGEEQE